MVIKRAPKLTFSIFQARKPLTSNKVPWSDPGIRPRHPPVTVTFGVRRRVLSRTKRPSLLLLSRPMGSARVRPMIKRTSYTFKLDETQQKALMNVLRSGNYRPMTVEHSLIATEGPDCNIALYKSGKCLVQGRDAAEWVTFTLEPQVLGEAHLGYEDVLNPEAIQPHMGIDESGKGDFFGPMVIAAAYVDETLVHALRELNVRDSKTITTDRKAEEMARDIRKLLGHRFALVTVGPTAYNRFVRQDAQREHDSGLGPRARHREFAGEGARLSPRVVRSIQPDASDSAGAFEKRQEHQAGTAV